MLLIDSTAANGILNTAVSAKRIKPHSIRISLLRSLLLTLGILLFGSAWLIDQVIDKELYARFDGELLAVARSLETLTLQEKNGIELQFSDAAMPSFSKPNKPDYFELLDANGVLIESSKSLSEAANPATDAQQVIRLDANLSNRALSFSDIALPDGRWGRLVRLRFQPLSGDSLDSTPANLRPTQAFVELHVARDMDVLTGVEARLHASLIAVVILLLSVAGTLVWWRVGRELDMIDRLAEQAQRIGKSQSELAISLEGVAIELMPLVMRINESSESIARAMDRERRWSRDLAHEMRTPITELKTMLEVAHAFPSTYTPERVQEQASQIAQEMDALVSALLLMARIEGGLDQVGALPVDLSALGLSILDSIKDESVRAWQLSLTQPLLVQSDAALARILLSNLIGNARSYAEPKSDVAIVAAIESGEVFFEISNFAPHLNQDDLTQMLGRFWRKPSDSSIGIRSGMGLSIAHALCEILQLRITLNLDENKRFSARLTGWRTH
jgi:two-component system, OmpR family, sensor histidine kinase QseC